MNTALVLAQVIITLLPMIRGDISALIRWISVVRTAAKQSGEWTDEMDLTFRNCLIASGHADEWQPDK